MTVQSLQKAIKVISVKIAIDRAGLDCLEARSRVSSLKIRFEIQTFYGVKRLFIDSENAYMIAGMDLGQVINVLKTCIEQKESSHDVYYSILERLQDIVINEPEVARK